MARYVASRRLSLGGYLRKSRGTHSPRDMVVPGLTSIIGAKVALRFPCAGPHSVPLYAAPPATFASVRPPAVRCHVAQAKTAVTSIYLHLLANPAGDPPDFDVGRLE